MLAPFKEPRIDIEILVLRITRKRDLRHHLDNALYVVLTPFTALYAVARAEVHVGERRGRVDPPNVPVGVFGPLDDRWVVVLEVYVHDRVWILVDAGDEDPGIPVTLVVSTSSRFDDLHLDTFFGHALVIASSDLSGAESVGENLTRRTHLRDSAVRFEPDEINVGADLAI